MSSPKTSELPNMPRPSIHELGADSALTVVKSRRSRYKGGRRLACSKRFEAWRTTEGISQLAVANRLVDVARKSTAELGPAFVVNFDPKYMLDRVQEFEYGRFKPPTWLILLLIRAYDLKLPWWEFWDGQQ